MESLFHGAAAMLLWPLVVAVTIASLTLPTVSLRRRALAGVVLVALAFASLAVSAGADSSVAGLPRSFLGITAALLLLGVAMLVRGVVPVIDFPRWTGAARWLGLGASAIAVLLGLRVVIPMAGAAGWGTMLASLAALLGIGALGAWVARLLQPGRAVRRVDDWLNGGPDSAPAAYRWDNRARWSLAINALCALLALATSSAVLLLLAALIGTIAGVLFERRLGRLRGWPPTVLLTLVALAIAMYVLIQVAAGTPLSLGGLVDAPYSDAFQLLLALILSLAAWALLRLWPFHAAPRGPFTGLLGAALLFRLVAPVLADGVLHWQPLFYPLAALAAWHAAATRRDAEAVTAIGALGLLSGSAASGWCGAGLVLGGTILALLGLLRYAGRTPNRRGDVVLRFFVMAGALLIAPVLDGALRAQVVYSVAAMLGLFAALCLNPSIDGCVDPAH